MKKENVTYDKAYGFALRIVKFYKYFIEREKEYIISKQLLRCGTSIGANVAEANGGISKKEFSAKISIAYKESLETKYWLNLLYDSKYIEKKVFTSLVKDCEELNKILFSILKTTRIEK
jgi:four helix bundle protein